MLINYMAQQSCFTAKELPCPASVNPQRLRLPEVWLPAAAPVLCSTPGLDPAGKSQGEGAEEETKMERKPHVGRVT